VTTAELPRFDLVVATVDRVDELSLLLASLARQTHRAFRVVLVDQNTDDRVDGVLRKDGSLDAVRLRAEPGLSRARNAALPHLRADLVAFPDDDCMYPDDLLERVARRFAAEPGLDGLTGRETDPLGSSSPSWARDAAVLTRGNLWNRAISFSIFLRRSLVAAVGSFDEQLGLGAGTPWSSGEEIEYLVRALDSGARIEYDPSIVVPHHRAMRGPHDLRAVGARDGASVGYILRKHRYPPRTLGRMLIRPAGGTLLALARGDARRAGFHAATLRGRLAGYRARTET
jgi:glycosyltransferase involved in cell wall biosynthesis